MWKTGKIVYFGMMKMNVLNYICSVESGGVQISGLMMYEIWQEWYPELKRKLTEVLGYVAGEPEERYDFKYWN